MRYSLSALLCCMFCMSSLAQVITGSVKDDKGEPIIGVSVTLKGTETATQTDAAGKFSIPAPGTGTLVFTAVGFIPQTETINNREFIQVVMVVSQSNMDEVVVIGYQKITRKLNSAAVSSISGKELENLPAASFEQLMQGRLAGVNVQNFTGEPGAAPTVQVRGTSTINRDYDQYTVTNQPLYVVDGIPQPAQDNYSPGSGTGTNYIAGINPLDIESIDVLRDASAAAIYGSRAANGVILITTKKGYNTVPRVNLSAYTGFTQRPELRDVAMGATERRQKLSMLDDLYAAGRLTASQVRNGMPALLTDSLNPAFNGNTDWQDLFYQVGRINNADLSLSGGGAGNMNYRFSTGYYNEEGIVKATGFTRYSMRLNLLAKALDKLTINPIISYSRTERARGSGSVGLSATTMPSSLFNASPAKLNYMLGAYDENLDENMNSQFSINLNMGYEFSKKLQFTSQTSYLYNVSRRDYNQTNELTGGQGNYSYGFSDNSINLRTSNYFNFNQTFGRHNLSTIFGMDAEFNQYKSLFAQGTNGVSDQIQVIAGFQQRHLSASSDYQAYGLLSYYSRFAYNFDERYVLSVSLRGDGSSRYGDKNKWGFFPSASAAWLISEEPFMQRKNSALTLLKLRGSYGTAGNLPGLNYLSYNLYRVNAGGYFGNNGATSYNGTAAITPNFRDGVAQPNISWEKSVSWNVGVETEFLNGKYQMMLDVYNKETRQILFDVLLPLTTGYDLAKTNSVGIRNAGVEMVLAASPLPRNSAVNWFSRLNVSYNRNQIMSLPNSGRDLIFSNGSFDKTHILSVGRPINAFYLYTSQGIFVTQDDIPINPLTGERFGTTSESYKPGDMWFVDLDGDSKIDPFNDGVNPDKLPMGDPNPKITGGWTNNFTFKNFTLSVFTSFVFDRDVLNIYESDLFENASGNSDLGRFASLSSVDFSKMNIWRKPGDQARYPAYPLGAYRYYYVVGQSFFLENGNFVRIKSISASYNLPRELIGKWKLRQFRIYGVMDNVLMLQASDRLPDAEAVDYYGQYTGGGYPIPKKYTLGIQMEF